MVDRSRIHDLQRLCSSTKRMLLRLAKVYEEFLNEASDVLDDDVRSALATIVIPMIYNAAEFVRIREMFASYVSSNEDLERIRRAIHVVIRDSLPKIAIDIIEKLDEKK